MKLLEVRRGADPELAIQEIGARSVRRQGLGLATARVQGPHVQGDDPFPKGVCGDEELEVGQHGRVVRQLELGRDALLDGGEPQRLEWAISGGSATTPARSSRAGPATPRAPPSALPPRPPGPSAEPAAPAEQLGEAQDVDLVLVDDQHVAGWPIRDLLPPRALRRWRT